jgi:hypothetical protein
MRTPRTIVAALSSHTGMTGVALTLIGVAVLAILTPPITFNNGLGNDGQIYVALAESLRGHAAEPPWGPFAYRVLPSAFAAWMPFDIPTGFLIVNILSILGSAILLLRLLDRYGVPSPVALLALVWWIALPTGVRWHIYYPVLADAYGFFVLLALIVCALERRLVLFAAALVAGVLARENLVLTIPLLWRAHVRTAPLRWTLLVGLAVVPAVVALLLIRAFPPVAPAAGSNSLSQSIVIAYEIALTITNYGGQAWRAFLAAPLSLGLLLVIPLLRFRRTVRFLSREMHWTYFALVAAVLALVGGRDNDRYFYLLAPLLLILTFAVHADLWRSWPRVAALTALQLIALRVGWPIGTTEHDYLQYTTAFMEFDRLVALGMLMAVASALAGVIVWSARRSGRDSDLKSDAAIPAIPSAAAWPPARNSPRQSR